MMQWRHQLIRVSTHPIHQNKAYIYTILAPVQFPMLLDAMSRRSISNFPGIPIPQLFRQRKSVTAIDEKSRCLHQVPHQFTFEGVTEMGELPDSCCIWLHRLTICWRIIEADVLFYVMREAIQILMGVKNKLHFCTYLFCYFTLFVIGIYKINSN